MNIIQIQERLKDVSDNELVKGLQQPTSGAAPQYLILSELQRRKRMRDEYQRQQAANMPTVAEEAVAAAGVPQGGIMQMAGAMAPKSAIAQDTGVNDMAPTPATRAPQEPMRMAEGGIIRMQQGSYRLGSSPEYNYSTFLAEMGLQDSPQARDMWQRYQARMEAAPMPGPTRTMRGLDVPPVAPSALPGGEMGDLGINRVMGPVDFDATAPAMPSAPARSMPPVAAVMPQTGGIAAIPPMASDMATRLAPTAAEIDDMRAARTRAYDEYDPYAPPPVADVLRQSLTPDVGVRQTMEEVNERAGEYAGLGEMPESGEGIMLGDIGESVIQGLGFGPAMELARRRGMAAPAAPDVRGRDLDADLGIGRTTGAAPTAPDQEDLDLQRMLSTAGTFDQEALAADAEIAALTGGKAPTLALPGEDDDREIGGGGAGAGGVGGAGGYEKIESRIERMLADREKRAESDKWLALAQAGMALMASKQPTLGGALGEAGLVGISQLRKSQAEADEDILGLLGTQRQIEASRASAARAGSGREAPTTSATERAAYFRAANDAASEAAALELALTRGGEIGEFGEITRPYSPEEISILTRQLNDARSRANMYSGLANPALANIQAAQ